MNLLVVDDQIKVVQGLINSIEWKDYGIEEVYGALSVAKAIEILNQHNIDILLCDIEMPIQSGLELISWIQEKKLDIRCILLTAHSKFAYAQQSIRLQVFDYILQPASYEYIINVVKRAIDDLKKQREQKQLSDLGEAFSSREREIVGGALHSWLEGNENLEEMKEYARLGKLPILNQNCVLGLIQILRWTVLDEWTPSLLAYALGNIAEELFCTWGIHLWISPMDRGDYVILIWDGEEKIVETSVEQQLELFLKVCQEYIGSIVAIYWCEPIEAKSLPIKWRDLEEMKRDNVARESAVFAHRDNKKIENKETIFHKEQMKVWSQKLCGDRPMAVEREANEILDQMSREGRLDAHTLRIFYQDFLQAFHNALGTSESFSKETLSHKENFKIYCEAAENVEKMKQFIHLAVSHFNQQSIHPTEELVCKIDEYIDSHMESEISRQSVADYVYLNVDYLNRLIHKATGYSLKEYISQRKLNHAKILLCTTHLPVAIIAFKVGYINAAHFSVAYKKLFGVTPMQTRQSEQI